MPRCEECYERRALDGLTVCWLCDHELELERLGVAYPDDSRQPDRPPRDDEDCRAA